MALRALAHRRIRTARRLVRHELPEFRIETIDSDDDGFVLALRTRNLAVAGLADPDDVVVINDADTLPEPRALRRPSRPRRAPGACTCRTRRTTGSAPEGLAELDVGAAPSDCSYVLVNGACSGVYVTTRRTWESHGGQDERFRGWGFEDWRGVPGARDAARRTPRSDTRARSTHCTTGRDSSRRAAMTATPRSWSGTAPRRATPPRCRR